MQSATTAPAVKSLVSAPGQVVQRRDDHGNGGHAAEHEESAGYSCHRSVLPASRRAQPMNKNHSKRPPNATGAEERSARNCANVSAPAARFPASQSFSATSVRCVSFNRSIVRLRVAKAFAEAMPPWNQGKTPRISDKSGRMPSSRVTSAESAGTVVDAPRLPPRLKADSLRLKHASDHEVGERPQRLAEIVRTRISAPQPSSRRQSGDPPLRA